MNTLKDKRIVVTRPPAPAAELCAALAARGAIPLHLPLIAIEPLTLVDTAPLAQLADYDWLIFTSANGVTTFAAQLQQAGHAFPASVRMAAIGPATTRAILQHGWPVHFTPREAVAEAIVAEIGAVRGRQILLPCAEAARETLAVELERRGARVNIWPIYRTRPALPAPSELQRLHPGIDLVTLASASAARSWAEVARQNPFLRMAPIACIGPTTAHAAHTLSLPVKVTAVTHTNAGLVTALETFFSQPEP